MSLLRPIGKMDPRDVLVEAEKIWQTAADELKKLSANINAENFSNVLQSLAECGGRIIVSGVGTSGAAAKKIAHSLSCIERPAFFLDPGDAVHGALGAAQPGDIAILISKGGNTGEVTAIIPALKKKHIEIIGVTENPESKLGKAADILLKVRVEKEADSFNMLATTSTMAVTAVFDALCILLMGITGFTREQFAVIHPGGAVGERLLTGSGEVSDENK